MTKYKGIYKGDDLSNADYHVEQEHLSSSNIKDLIAEKSKFGEKLWGIEKFYQEKILGNRKTLQKDVFDEGSLVHGLILEPHLVDEEFVQFPGMRKAGAAWTAFVTAEQSGKNRTILSKPQWMRCVNLVKGYNANSTAVDIVKSCDKELSLFNTIEDVPLKVRADLINIDEGYIGDIKTTSYDTDVDSFKFTMKDFGYATSAALYLKLFEEHFGKPFYFMFVVLGKKDRSCEIYRLSAESRAVGDREIFKAMKLYKKCKKSGIWKIEKPNILKKEYKDYEILEV